MTTIDMSLVIKRADLDRLIDAVQPAVILRVIGQRLISFVDESFRTRGRGGWRPLAPVTIAMRLGGSDAPLQDTGKYKQSFVSETDGATYVEVGTNLKVGAGIPLASIHEHGVTIHVKQARVLAAQSRGGQWFHFGKEVTIPARPVLPTAGQAVAVLKPTLEGMLERTKIGGSA